MGLKAVAYGFVMHEHSYLRDARCQLDFAIVVSAWLSVCFPSSLGGIGFFQRTFRIQRDEAI